MTTQLSNFKKHVWSVEEFRFCGAASRVDEWIIILAYEVISDQRANVFNFMLPAWVRALLSTANCMNGLSHQQILETRTSHLIVRVAVGMFASI